VVLPGYLDQAEFQLETRRNANADYMAETRKRRVSSLVSAGLGFTGVAMGAVSWVMGTDAYQDYEEATTTAGLLAARGAATTWSTVLGVSAGAGALGGILSAVLWPWNSDTNAYKAMMERMDSELAELRGK